MATQDEEKTLSEETEQKSAGREQLDLGEVEDLAGGKKTRGNKPIKLPEL